MSGEEATGGTLANKGPGSQKHTQVRTHFVQLSFPYLVMNNYVLLVVSNCVIFPKTSVCNPHIDKVFELFAGNSFENSW